MNTTIVKDTIAREPITREPISGNLWQSCALASDVSGADWLPLLQEIIAKEGRAILAMVTANRGSTPRDKGSWMIITPQSLRGTLGGGELEYRSWQTALSMLDRELAWQRRYVQWHLGPDLGQCCGGATEILLEPVDHTAKVWLDQVSKPQASHLGIYFSTDANIPPCPMPYAEKEEGHWQAIGSQRPLLVVIGGGHVGQTLIKMAASLPIQTWLVDGRDSWLANFKPPPHSRLMIGDPLTFVENIPANAAVVIMTHSHDLDYQLGGKLLARRDLSFLGVIGSKTKTARFRKHWADDGLIGPEGFPPYWQMPLAPHAPAGKEPGIISLGILGEIMQIFRPTLSL